MLQASAPFAAGLVFRYEFEKHLNICIDLGRTFNKNKNPVAENAIKEDMDGTLRGGGEDLASITHLQF